MRRSRVMHFVHLIWATKGREPLLTSDIERRIHRCIVEQAESLGCTVHAIGGMPDHVHLVVLLLTRTSIAELMKQIKGVSSALVNDLWNHLRLFRWQEGYAVYSVCPSHLDTAITYVLHQKQHHAEGMLRPEWEETDEETPYQED